MNNMGSKKLTAEEWETFLGLADRLGIPVRELRSKDAKFHVLESAGYALGRVVAQAATEQMALLSCEKAHRAATLPHLRAKVPRCPSEMLFTDR